MLPERPAEARQQAGPGERADRVEYQERHPAHPRPPGHRVDDRARDWQEHRDDYRRPREPAAPAVHPGDELLPAPALPLTSPGEEVEYLLAPQPAGPPVDDVELHQAWNRGEQDDDQRAVPHAGERRGRHD